MWLKNEMTVKLECYFYILLDHLMPMNLNFSPKLIPVIYIGLGYKARKQKFFTSFLDFEKYQSNYTQLPIFYQPLVVATLIHHFVQSENI
jgi:hypothetical protein